MRSLSFIIVITIIYEKKNRKDYLKVHIVFNAS